MPVLCLLSLISRISLKQLGMVSPELRPLAIAQRWFASTRSRGYRRKMRT